MKRKLLLFLLSICFFLPDFAATGQYNFIRVDGGSGLSNSHVKSIIQDSYGFIWLGTRNGLNRYDGVSMKLYNCYDETLQHGNQVISALFEDNHRQLWVGTDDGVYIQELATGKFSFFDARTESGEQIRYNWIEDILADHSGNLQALAAPGGGLLSRSGKDPAHGHHLGRRSAHGQPVHCRRYGRQRRQRPAFRDPAP